MVEAGRRSLDHDANAGSRGSRTYAAVDFEQLVREPGAGSPLLRDASVVFIALGTTLRRAGSRDAFRRVDLDYVHAVGSAARQAGVPHLVAISSLGASVAGSTFYLRVKGEAEEALTALEFPSLTIVRPSLLLGERSEVRRGERASAVLLGAARPLLRGPFQRYRPISARVVARAMVRAAADPPNGVAIFESHHLASLGA